MFISRDVSPPAHQFAVTKGKTSHRRGSPSDRQAARVKFSILTSDLNPFRVIFGRQTLQDSEVLFFADDHEMDALAELPQRFDELGGDRQAAFDGIGSFIEALDHRGWNMNAGNFSSNRFNSGPSGSTHGLTVAPQKKSVFPSSGWPAPSLPELSCPMSSNNAAELISKTA